MITRFWHEGTSPSIAAIACLAIVFSSACGFQLQKQPLLRAVGEVELTGKLDPEFRQVLQRTIEDNRDFSDGGLPQSPEVAFKVNFVAMNETITHLTFDQFREPLQSELEIECRITIGKGEEPASEVFLVTTRRFNYSRDHLLAVTSELQEAREDIHREFSRRIVVLLAEVTGRSISENGQDGQSDKSEI